MTSFLLLYWMSGRKTFDMPGVVFNEQTYQRWDRTRGGCFFPDKVLELEADRFCHWQSNLLEGWFNFPLGVQAASSKHRTIFPVRDASVLGDWQRKRPRSPDDNEEMSSQSSVRVMGANWKYICISQWTMKTHLAGSTLQMASGFLWKEKISCFAASSPLYSCKWKLTIPSLELNLIRFKWLSPEMVFSACQHAEWCGWSFRDTI